MALRAHHFGVTFMIAAIVLGSLAFLTTDSRTAQAACAAGASVTITYPSTASATLSGIVTLKATAVPTGATGLGYTLLPSNTALGQATLNGSDWVLNWDTRNQPNAGYQIMAIAHYGTSTTQDCASVAVPVNVANTATQSPKLTAALIPSNAQMPVGGTASFNVDSVYVDQYGRQSHVSPATISWKPLGATVASYSGTSVVIKAGTVAMSGNLGVDVTYSGSAAHADAPLKILAPTSSPSPTPSPSASPSPSPTVSPLPISATPAPLSEADAERLGALDTIFRPSSPTNSAPLVSLPTLGCIEKSAGEIRFTEISSGQSQPTSAERKAAAGCFSGIEPLPAILAPVAPAHITELPTTDELVTLASIKKQTLTGADGKTINTLHLSGTGAPNTSVYIYVFSDPLVLRAQTNGSGAWEYVLETPLPTGNHEVYAVAEKDSDNFVRTSAVPIAIAAAAPGTQNGALVIENKWTAAQLAYAGGAALMVLFAIIAFFIVIRGRRRRRRLAEATALIMPNAAPPAPAAMPVQSEADAAARVEQIVNSPVKISNAPGGTVDPTFPHDPQA